MIVPKLSVIIPIYNSEKFLDQCLCSVLAQTLISFELILVDDGSTDDSISKIISYMKRDSRIQLYQQKHKGPGPARNLGLKMAQGKYLLFLDSDDFFEPNMFEKLYKKAEKEKTDVLSFWYSKFDQERQREILVRPNTCLTQIPKGKVFNPMHYSEFLFQLSGGEAWRYFFRMDFVKTNRFEFGKTFLGEDGAFTYPARALAKRMCYLDDVFVHYRINSKKQLTNGSALKSELKKAYRQTWKNLKKYHLHKELKHSFEERKKEAKVWLKIHSEN